MSFSVQLQPQTVTVKNMTRCQQQPLRYISDPVFQTVDSAVHLINRYKSELVVSRVDRVSHPFDHPGPYIEERGSCPC